MNHTQLVGCQYPQLCVAKKLCWPGGDICIYVKKELKTNIIKFLPKQTGIEDLWFSVQSSMSPAIIIGCVYRHPKASVDSLEYLQDV